MAETDKSTLVNISFAGGIDERNRPELVDAAQSFLVLRNTRQSTVGALTARKGFTSLSSLDFRDGRLAPYKNTVAMHSPSGDGVYVYSETSASFNAMAGSSSSTTAVIADVTRVPILRAQGIVDASFTGYMDMAIVNGYAVVVWCAPTTGIATGGYTIYSAIYDATTWAPVRGPTAVNAVNYGNATPVPIVNFGNFACLALDHGSLNTLDILSLNTTSPATIAAGWTTTTVGTTYTSGRPYDITANATGIYIAHENNSGTANSITAYLFSSPTALTGTVFVDAGAIGAVDVLGIGCDSSSVWLTFGRGGDVHATAFGTNLAVTGTRSVVMVGVVPSGKLGLVVSGAITYITATNNSATFYNNANVTAGAVASGTVKTSYNTAYATRPIAHTMSFERTFALAQANQIAGGNSNTQLLVNALPNAGGYLSPVANVAPLLCRSLDPSSPYQHFPQISANKFACLMTATKNQASDSLEILVFEFRQKHLCQVTSIADGSYTSGGMLALFDGAQWMEPNSVMVPSGLSGTPTAAAGTITVTAGWRYIAIFERTDSAGNVHWSGLSSPSALVTFANKAGVVVQVSTLPISMCASTATSASRWNIAFYRTTGDSVTGVTGTTYYRVGSVANSTSTSTVSFTDTMTDATLTTRTQLYRQTAVLGAPQNRELPPGLRYLTTHNDRLVGVAADGISIWYSAKHVLGEGMWFSSLFQFPVEAGGPITGLASMYGRLYVFKRSGIFVVDGDGPSENGASGDFSLPSRLPAGVGCIDANSICVSPVGTFFQSDRGIELLAVSNEVTWIGDMVLSTLATYPVVTSAVVNPVESTVMITLTGASLANGVTLVYDYSVNKWVSTDLVTATNIIPSCGATSACVANYLGVPTYHRINYQRGIVRQSTNYLDEATWVSVSATTGWLKLQTQGEQDATSAVLLAEKNSNHDITIGASYNYSTTETQARTWTAAENTLVTTALGREQLELVSDNNRRCQAVRYRITTATPTLPGTYPVGTGQGATLIALTLEVQPRAGRVKLPATSR